MTADQERAFEPQARLVELAAFDLPTKTSFVRTLGAVFTEAALRGWRLELVLPRAGAESGWAEDLRKAGVSVHAAPERNLEEWVEGLLGVDATPTLLHSHFTEFDLAAGGVAHRRKATEAVWHFHTVLTRTPWMVGRHAAKLAMARKWKVAAMATPSETMKKGLVRRGAPRDKVHVFHSSIDLNAFPLWTLAERNEFRKRLGYRPGAVVLLHFGWDWKLKGGDRFLATIARLREDGLDVVGLTRAGPEAEEEIERSGLSDVVHVQPPSDPWEFFGVAHVLMATSRGEGLPYSLLEALASGTAIVATDIGGHRPVADASLCTITAPDPDSLADGVRSQLALSPAELQAEAESSRAFIAREFSSAAYAERMVDLFADLLHV